MKYKILIEESKENQILIKNALSGRKSEGKRKKVVAGFLSLSMQHHHSISLLVENKLYSSAFALLRPLFDAVYRGTWISLAASDDEIENFSIDKDFEFKNTYKLAKDIDKKINVTTFHDVYKQNSPLLHGMTHGGIEQIGRQFDKDGDTIQTTFDNEALFALLNSSNVSLGMILLAFGDVEEDELLINLAHKIIKEE
jgi:hypothetical protein